MNEKHTNIYINIKNIKNIFFIYIYKEKIYN